MRKKILLFAAVMLMALGASAQVRSNQGNNRYGIDNRHEVSVGYGIGTSSEFVDMFSRLFSDAHNGKTFGAVSASYFYNVTPLIGVGGVMAYSSRKFDVVENSRVIGDQKYHYMTVMPAVKLNWLRRENFGLYSKLAAGVTYCRARDKRTTLDAKTVTRKEHDYFFNFQASLIGVEVGRQVCGFAEAGFGEQGFASVGVRFKF